MISHKQGELILFSDGEYSDYSTGPMVRVVKDLDLGELAKEFHDQAPTHKYYEERKDADRSSFAIWLNANGWTEELEYDEVHTGSYGTFELEEMARSAAERAKTIQ